MTLTTPTVIDFDLTAAHEARTERRVSPSNPLRATCGCCLRTLTLNNGKVVGHINIETGRKCPGAGCLPYEQSNEGILAESAFWNFQAMGWDSKARKMGNLKGLAAAFIAKGDSCRVIVAKLVEKATKWAKRNIKRSAPAEKLIHILSNLDGVATVAQLIALGFCKSAQVYRAYWNPTNSGFKWATEAGVTARLRKVDGELVLVVARVAAMAA